MTAKKPFQPVFLRKAFAQAIIEKRTQDDLTLREAAADCGIPDTRFWRAESGQMVKVDTYISVCHWLGKPFDFFITKPAV